MLSQFLNPQQMQAVKQTPQWAEMHNKTVQQLQQQAPQIMYEMIGQIQPQKKIGALLDFFK